MTPEQRIEYFMSEIARLSNQVVDLQNERDALAATVKALQKALSDAVAAFRQYELSVDDYPTIKHKLFMQALNDELETTPQQHLAEIRAEAVLRFAGHVLAQYRYDVTSWSSQYADSIRQEVK